ncbi:MAG: hypothetical protein PQJ47_06355 [Sphaerochaetaceae bacterium]|nr:hypothetical protein [Sphaerochaetaceae bacterium]
MKKTLLIVVLVMVLMTPLFAMQKNDGIGVGVTLGYPTGLTMRYGMDDFRVLGNLTWNYGSGFYLDAGALYDITEVEVADLPVIINAGAQLGLGINNSAFAFSVNGVVGASYYMDDYPVEVFVNLAPGVAILPSMGFSFKGGVGALWYFE